MIRQLLLNRKNWDKTAIIDGDKHYTYRDLAKKAIAIQEQLIRPGNVAIFLPSGTDYIAAFFGTLMAGMVAFPINCQLTKYEVLPLLAQASVYTVITCEKYRSVFEDVALQVLYVEKLTELGNESLPSIVDVDEHKQMVLLNTSGTTGNPKIVQLSEKNIAVSTLAYLDKMDYETGDVRYVIATPFSSAYGILALTACVIKAFPIVLLQEAFTLDALYRAVETYRVTHYEGGVMVAILMDQLAGRPIRYDIRSLRYFGLAGSKISADILHRLSKAFPQIEFWTGYGMTEASPLIAKPDKKMLPEKFASVGTAIKGETILIEVDGTLTSTPYTNGEIVVKGPNVMMGYLHNKKETDKVIKNGYLHTGDIGYLDEDGYLYICGRKKNLIIVRGFNVHAEEVEACILNSKLAKDCFVYGQTDAAGNETVCADIVPAEPDIRVQDIRHYCGVHLSSYKQPQQIRLLNKIEKTATGKNKKGSSQ